MRTEAIFARGSCRALKWMAVFGMVFALGGGEAAAQEWALTASSNLEEGASLVPVTVTFTAPRVPGRTVQKANILVEVVVPTRSWPSLPTQL